MFCSILDSLSWAVEKNKWTVAQLKILFSETDRKVEEWRTTPSTLLAVQFKGSTVSNSLGCHPCHMLVLVHRVF